MLEVIKKLQMLQRSAYDYDRDQKEVIELYEDILQVINDKDSFQQNSLAMLKALENNGLSDFEEKQWLGYAAHIYAAYAAVKIYKETMDETLYFSREEVDQVLNFYSEHIDIPNIKSMGIYACARQLAACDPMRCYELIKMAFTVDRSLAENLGISYRYEGKAAEENLTEVCPFCGSGKNHHIPHYCSPQITQLQDNKILPPAKLWMKCDKCENLFTYNFPVSEAVLINGTYSKKKGEMLGNKYLLSLYNPIFNQFKMLAKGTDYLEIGVGTGEMLAAAQEFGYHVEAVEICREDGERISSVLDVNINWCDIVNYETDKQYDVIVMGDVLEHVTEPLYVLKKVKRMLKEDGVLWISTPNYNSAYARMQKFSHCMWHIPTHYTYVSHESLKKLLDNLDMQIVHYDISARYIGSMEVFVKHMEDAG